MRHLRGGLKEFWLSKINAFRERKKPLLLLEAPAPSPRPDRNAPPVEDETAAETKGSRRWRPIRLFAAALACAAVAPFLLIALYRVIDPPVSALMLYQRLSGGKVAHQWRPLEQISPELLTAVLVSEDAQFCSHWGVDWSAVGEAWGHAEDGGKLRGASTIPMQTAKNLLFWPGRSYVRKVAEAPLAYFMSVAWPKDRVMEVYLNIVEWGPGVFGAEAAAQYHFHKPASQLNGYEAAALAASLPNPIERRAGRPGPQTYRLIGRLRKRVAVERRQARCVVDRRGASSVAVAGTPVHNRKAETPKQERQKQEPQRKDASRQDLWGWDQRTQDGGTQEQRAQDQRKQEAASQDREETGRDGRSRDRWDDNPWSRDRSSDRDRDWIPGDSYEADYSSGQGGRWRP